MLTGMHAILYRFQSIEANDIFVQRNIRKSNDSLHVIQSLTVQFKCIERFDVFCNIEATTEWTESEEKKDEDIKNLERHLFCSLFPVSLSLVLMCVCVIWNNKTPKKGI